ncbi:MAG: hypothetical protein L0Y72_21620 [Gemmataceae bacterium]|nr:hypothetical protein [Gemmataceae bacterium]
MSKRVWRLVRLVTVAVLALVVTGALRPSARQDADDPFARENRAKPKLSRASQELQNVISFSVTVDPPQAKPGEVFKVIIKGKPKDGYYTYPITKRSPEQGDGSLTKLSFEENQDLQRLWPIKESEPEFVVNDLGEVVLEHKKEFTWTQEFLVFPDAKPGKKAFDVYLNIQVCDKRLCIGPALFPPIEAVVEVFPGEAVALSKEIKERQGLKEPAVAVVPPPANVAAKPNPPGSKTNPDRATPTGTSLDRPQDFFGLLGAAFLGAILMLFTPCVFPMIPITVNFFLKQSEKEHHNPLMMASVYSGTIIALLTLAMLAFGTVVIALANDPWFNLILGGVLIVFALSLFGMFEIELPSFLARFTSAREGQGGMLGTVFMALTFTITSFTCTGPFIGLLLAPIAGIQPPWWQLLAAAVVYSATFAAPFFLLALFPTMLKKLPKSGGWLNSIKVTMGFLELGAALKFLANTDYAWFPGNPRLFTFDTVLCAWIALSFACGLYLLGVFRLPHDDPPEHIGVVRMMFATIFFGMTIYMVPALFGGRLQGIVGEGVMAFLPPKLSSGPGGVALGGAGPAHAEKLAWHLHYEDAWKEAVKEKKLILIDFTGVFCTNCRDNEENVFPLPEVVAEMKKYVRVQLYTDTVPDKKLTASQAKELADRNARRRDKIANPTNPTYVVFRPDYDQPFDADDYLKGAASGVENGKIFNVAGFVQFLRQPLKTQTAQAQPAAMQTKLARDK